MFADNSPKILNLDRYNGRINIIQPPDMALQFQMTEKIQKANKSSDYRDATAGIFEDNLLSTVFFSAGNIQILQNGLRAGVHKLSKGLYVIPEQNLNNLKIIMRSTYLQNVMHTKYNGKITAEVERLNKLVLDYCIPTVYNEAVGYEKYTQDQSSLAIPLEHPKQNDRDYRQLELYKTIR